MTKHAKHKTRRGMYDFAGTGSLGQAEQHQRRIEGDGGERIRGYCPDLILVVGLGFAALMACSAAPFVQLFREGDDGYTRHELAECPAKGVLIDGHVS